MQEYIITYQSITADNNLSEVRQYKCSDGNDYRRCVDLFHEGKVVLLTVNGKPIRDQKRAAK